MTSSSNPKDRIGATKIPLTLIPLSAQIHAALAHFDGSLKYGVYNWRRESVAASIYVDAALRHIHKWFHGEASDRDSGIHHLGHALACLNIILDAQAYGNLIDDRPPGDDSPSMVDFYREEVIRLLKLRGKDVPSTPPVNAVDERREPIPNEDGTSEPCPPGTCGACDYIRANPGKTFADYDRLIYGPEGCPPAAGTAPPESLLVDYDFDDDELDDDDDDYCDDDDDDYCDDDEWDN